MSRQEISQVSALALDEGQQIAIEVISMGEEHAMAASRVDFECAARDPLSGSASTEIQGSDVIVIPM